MANATGMHATEWASSLSLVLAVLVEVGALLGNGALLAVVLRTPGLQDALYLAHLCVVDLLAAASIVPLGLVAAPPPGLGLVRLGPAPCLGPFRPLWALLAFALPALLLLVAYGTIFFVARRAALRPPRGNRLRSDSLDSRLSFLTPLRPPRLPGGKAALAPALAIGQFAACWLPYGCACLAPAARAAAAEAAVTWVAYTAFAVHPFLYGLMQRPVRLALGRLTRRVLPRPLRVCLPQAWHPRELLKRLQGPSKDPALGAADAPEQAQGLAGGLGAPEAT
uniref:G protein-coupled receptor 62 n=1 Tax=Jaculus jaculus TaxID=51337 RepID=A0A8C5KFC5_JACJA